MPLSYDADYAVAMAPIAELLASRKELPVHDVLGRREVLNTSMKQMAAQLPPNPTVKRTDHIFTTHDGVQLTLAEFRKKDAQTSTPTKALYFIHGGGMILGSVDVFEPSIIKKVEDFGCPVFAVGYRLAPEFPGLCPVKDCFAGLKWLSEHAAELGIDPAKIVTMGESAGGGLAAGVSLLARDFSLQPPIAKQILIFPMLDDRTIHPIPALTRFASWKISDNLTGWTALLGPRAGSPDPESVSPYEAPARAETLAGLPSTYIEVGQLDIFCGEDVQFAGKLVEAGVEVELHVYPGVPHAFMIYAPQAEISRAAAENVKRAVRVV